MIEMSSTRRPGVNLEESRINTLIIITILHVMLLCLSRVPLQLKVFLRGVVIPYESLVNVSVVSTDSHTQL